MANHITGGKIEMETSGSRQQQICPIRRAKLTATKPLGGPIGGGQRGCRRTPPFLFVCEMTAASHGPDNIA